MNSFCFCLLFVAVVVVVVVVNARRHLDVLSPAASQNNNVD